MPTAHDAAATVCCHVMTSGAAHAMRTETRTALPIPGLDPPNAAIGPTKLATALVTSAATATTEYNARLGACAMDDATSAAPAVSTGSHAICPFATRPALDMRCA